MTILLLFFLLTHENCVCVCSFLNRGANSTYQRKSMREGSWGGQLQHEALPCIQGPPNAYKGFIQLWLSKKRRIDWSQSQHLNIYENVPPIGKWNIWISLAHFFLNMPFPCDIMWPQQTPENCYWRQFSDPPASPFDEWFKTGWVVHGTKLSQSKVWQSCEIFKNSS